MIRKAITLPVNPLHKTDTIKLFSTKYIYRLVTIVKNNNENKYSFNKRGQKRFLISNNNE